MKVLFLALLCVAAAAAYSGEELEDALFEDYSIFDNIRERMEKGFEAVLEKIRALVEKHKPLVETFKQRLADLKEKVKSLLTEHGNKFLETIREVRTKIQQLLRDVLNKIAVDDKAAEYALVEEEEEVGPWKQLLQRIKERVVAAFNKLKDVLSEHKEIMTDVLKQKFEEVKKQLAELTLEHGGKLIEHARQILVKIANIFKDVMAKIGITQESALYAVEEEGETFLQALKRRIIERLQKFADDLKNRIDQLKGDFHDKVVPKLQEIRDKIRDLATQSGEKLLETAGQITQKIREIFEEIRKKVAGETYLYADEDENPTFIQRFVKRLQNRLKNALARAQSLLSKHKEIFEQFKEKVSEISTKIVELAEKKRDEIRQAAREIRQKISQLVKDVLAKIGVSSYYADEETILAVARTLRDFFSSAEGIKALKDNARIANPTTQTGMLIKAFIMASTDPALKELVLEMFKNVNYASGSASYEDIRDLVKKATAWLQTAEGIREIRGYAQKLETTHPVVLRLKAMLEDASDDDVRALIKDIFSIN